MRVGVVALGYADGFLRAWSGGKGLFRHENAALPVLGFRYDTNRSARPSPLKSPAPATDAPLRFNAIIPRIAQPFLRI